MRSRTAPDFRYRCRGCYLRHAFCICADIPKVPAKTGVIIVRHALEAWKTTNTARLASLALPKSTLLEQGGIVPLDTEPLTQPRTWLLFPGVAPRPEGTPEQLVVLDGSWPQARRMAQRIDVLHTLPRFSLDDVGRQAPNLRTPPFAGALSTLEAIAAALSLIEGDETGAPLRALHELFIKRALASRGR
jgi:DTW domain-containing protein YfiP